MYIPRYSEKLIENVHATFKILYLGGPRQVGKTTLLLHLANKLKVNYVTLDDLTERELAKRDPELFLENHPSPLLVDEVQYAPELFSSLKLRVDRSAKRGQYWLSGSQHFALIRNLQESLAGRVGIVGLLGFSAAEIARIPVTAQPFLPDRKPPPSHIPKNIHQVYEHVFRGSFPALWHKNPPDRERYYNSYVQTYLDRDLSALFHITKLPEFHVFLQLCAARTGQMLNLSELARDAGVSVHAAREWMSILENTSQVYLLRPYHRNFSKRVVKTPKLYFLDTGFAAYLTKWHTPETLAAGAMAGSFFETWVVSEIIKSFLFRGIEPPLYYFRDKEGHEIDVLIEQNQALYLIEIKRSIKVSLDDIKHIEYLKKLHQLDSGAVISLAPKLSSITREIRVLPTSFIS